MRRIGMIVALGALLGMLGGAAVASPALARGHGWPLADFRNLRVVHGQHWGQHPIQRRKSPCGHVAETVASTVPLAWDPHLA